MPIRRLFGVGLWLLTTVAATAMVWTATSVVAADVTDHPAPVVAHRDVVSALSGSAPAPSPPTTTAVPNPATTAHPGPSTSPPSIRPTPTTTPPPSTPFAPFPVATTTTLKLATPTTRPPSPPTTFVGVTATYATDGGTVSVACTGPSTIRLVSATPADGYIVYVVSPGPQYVGLRFQSTSNGVTFAAGCVYGQPLRAANPPPTTTTTSGVPAP